MTAPMPLTVFSPSGVVAKPAALRRALRRLVALGFEARLDEDALIESLRSGTIAAAGLDVFAAEPTPAERWKDVPNVSLTPHIGGGVREAVLEQADMVLDNLRRFHAGEVLAHRLV